MRTLATIAVPHGGRLRAASLTSRPRIGARRLGVAELEHGASRHAGDPLLTAGEVAAMLQVTTAWVYAYTRAKRIPHVPLGRYVRYRRSAVLEWIAQLERDTCHGGRASSVKG